MTLQADADIARGQVVDVVELPAGTAEEQRELDCSGDRVELGARFHAGDEQHAAGPDAILDDELLAEVSRQPLTEHPRHDVVRPAGRKADHPVHGTAGIFVGGVSRREQTRTDDARQQEQK